MLDLSCTVAAGCPSLLVAAASPCLNTRCARCCFLTRFSRCVPVWLFELFVMALAFHSLSFLPSFAVGFVLQQLGTDKLDVQTDAVRARGLACPCVCPCAARVPARVHASCLSAVAAFVVVVFPPPFRVCCLPCGGGSLLCLLCLLHTGAVDRADRPDLRADRHLRAAHLVLGAEMVPPAPAQAAGAAAAEAEGGCVSVHAHVSAHAVCLSRSAL